MQLNLRRILQVCVKELRGMEFWLQLTKKVGSLQSIWSLHHGIGTARSFHKSLANIVFSPGGWYRKMAMFAANGVTMLPCHALAAGGAGRLTRWFCMHEEGFHMLFCMSQISPTDGKYSPGIPWIGSPLPRQQYISVNSLLASRSFAFTTLVASCCC